MLTTGKVRLSFVNIFNPRTPQDGGDPKYSVTILIPKSDAATLNAIYAAMENAIQEGLSGVFAGQRPPKGNIPLYDGDGLRQSGEEFGPECKGHMVMTASSLQKPEVVDKNIQPIMSQSEVYSGCYGRVSLRFFAYNKAGRKGIGCGLGNVMKLEDGEALGGRTSAADDFGTPDYAPQQPYTQPAYQQPAPAPQQPAYQQPAPAPQQPAYQQPTQGYPPVQQPTYQAQPNYAPQQPVPPQAPPNYAPQQQIDPITGRPVVSGVMGI